MLKRADTVWVICVDGDQVVLTRDTQPHRGTKTTLPGGKVDPGGRSLLAAAQR